MLDMQMIPAQANWFARLKNEEGSTVTLRIVAWAHPSRADFLDPVVVGHGGQITRAFWDLYEGYNLDEVHYGLL